MLLFFLSNSSHPFSQGPRGHFTLGRGWGAQAQGFREGEGNLGSGCMQGKLLPSLSLLCRVVSGYRLGAVGTCPGEAERCAPTQGLRLSGPFFFYSLWISGLLSFLHPLLPAPRKDTNLLQGVLMNPGWFGLPRHPQK